MLDRTQNIANGIKLSVVDLPKRIFSKRTSESDSSKMKMPEKAVKENVKPPAYFTMFAAELLGTGLLMFLGCMGCISQVDDPPPSHHMGSLAFGLVVMLIIQLFGHISGAHLNPAVTIATVLFQQLTPLMGAVYIVAQFIGATLGFGLLKILVPEEYTGDGFCLTKPHSLISTVQALAIEIVITTVLVVVCCSVWDKRNADKPDSVPLRFGFVIVAISMVAGPFTGASMNTARSFAPVVFDGNWSNQWIYWVGPNVAAVLGCGLYKYLFALEESEEATKEEQFHLEDINVSHTNSIDKV